MRAQTRRGPGPLTQSSAGRRLSTVRGWVVQLAIVMIVSAIVCSQSWFYADDWIMAIVLPKFGTTELLTYNYFGHFMPGFAVLQRFFWATFGPNWFVASLITGIILGLVSVAARRLVESTTDRPGVWGFVAGVMIPLSLSFLMCAGWWSATMQPLLPAAAGISVVGATTRYYRTGRARYLLSLALMNIVAMSFFEKSAIYAAFAGLWCLLVVEVPGGVRQVLAQVWRRWRAWVVLAVIDAAFLAVYVSGDYADVVVAAPAGTVAAFAARSVGLGVIPATFGIDLLRVPDVLVAPLAVVCAVMMAGIWIVLIRRKRANLALLAFWVTMLVLAELPLAIGRSMLLGPEAGRLLRYQLDAGALTIAVLAVAAARARVEELGNRTAGRVVFSALTGLLLVATTLSAAVTLRMYLALHARDWHRAFTASWPTTGVVRVVDGPLHGPVAPAWLYPFSRSQVLPLIVDNIEMVDRLEGSMAVGQDGRVGPAEFRPEITLGPGRCVPSITSDSVKVSAKPMTDYDVRVTVVAAAPGPVRLLATNGADPTAVVKTTDMATGKGTALTWFTATRSIDGVGIDAPTPVCIESVELGHIVPR